MSVNILHVRASTGFGGAENIILEICKNIDAAHFKCSIYTTFPDKLQANTLSDLAHQQEIPCHISRYSSRYSVKSVRSFLHYLNEHQIDVVHAHGYREDILAAFARRFGKVATVATVHGWTTGLLRKRIEISALKQLHRVIAVSPAIVRELQGAAVSKDKIELISNFVDPEHFFKKPPDMLLKQKLGFSNGDFVVGTAARLSPEKGLKDFIRAAAVVAEKQSNVKFLIVGDGPERNQLHDLVDTLGLRNVIHFAGYRTEMADIYNLMDVYVSTSFQDQTPRSILEAAASERPIIGTDVGGVSQIIENEYSGFLVPARSPERVAAVIIKLLHNRERCEEIGKNARQEVARDYEPSKAIQKMEAIYRNLTANRS